ncbi:hypothetical protein, unknown function [Leishmania tarentolae]|uniref:Uncharacterized protein n=1 Tax=Leishmania tarentolae TaxID=5689 RepID=A0A640KMW5_LEITA|nr:hypothetical protein, unknown function [Leishmania tarentolae]
MSDIVFCLPAALQLVVPPFTEVSLNVPSDHMRSDCRSTSGVFKVKQTPFVYLHEPLTLEQSIRAHEADKEPESNVSESLDAAYGYVVQHLRLSRVDPAHCPVDHAPVTK